MNTNYNSTLNRIGIDVGKKRIGIATAPKGTKIAFAHKTVELEKEQKTVDPKSVESVYKEIEQYLPAVFYIGLPLNLSAKMTDSTKYALKWAGLLGEKLGCVTNNLPSDRQKPANDLISSDQYNKIETSSIFMVDERFSTVTAQRNFLEVNVKPKDKKKIVDQEAARIILQSALDYEERASDYAGKSINEFSYE